MAVQVSGGDLRPAPLLAEAGGAGGNVEPLPLPALAVVRLGTGQGTWANERHLAPKHVPQLRQLIQAGLAKESPEARDTRIVLDLEGRTILLVELHQFRLARLGVNNHRAKLVHEERLAAPAA